MLGMGYLRRLAADKERSVVEVQEGRGTADVSARFPFQLSVLLLKKY